jgi:hypothetical protein
VILLKRLVKNIIQKRVINDLETGSTLCNDFQLKGKKRNDGPGEGVKDGYYSY